MRVSEGKPVGAGRRFGVVASRFNQPLVDALLEGALACLREHGVAEEDVHVVRVPGAWEVPAALEALGRAGGYAALVALAVVIRGETAHFDYICAECARGVAEAGRRTGVPIGFGVLTCETRAQAEARAGGAKGNKGREAAAAALEMADLLGRLEPAPAARG